MTEGDIWGVVEIMGRRTRAGRLSDAQMGGATLLQIEHPTVSDHTGTAPLREMYGPQAIFGIRLCSQDEATTVAAWAWRQPAAMPSLGPVLEDLIDDDDDEEDEEDDDVRRGPVQRW